MVVGENRNLHDMNLIYDEDQVRKFHSLLKPLENDEVYFLSMSARNKYLTAEERLQYDLGRTEMMSRKLIKTSSVENYLRALRSYEVEWTGRSFVKLPSKCLVVYANINVSSGKKALQEFYQKTTEYLFHNDVIESYRHLDTLLLNCFQRAQSSKTLLDLDFDCGLFSKDVVFEEVNRFRAELCENHVVHHVIETRSGFHVLLERATLKYNYTKTLEEIDKLLQTRNGEAIMNKNAMVPVPGCLCADFPVRLH